MPEARALPAGNDFWAVSATSVLRLLHRRQRRTQIGIRISFCVACGGKAARLFRGADR